MITFNVKIDEEQRDLLRALADSQERTMAAEVRLAIREHIERVKAEKGLK